MSLQFTDKKTKAQRGQVTCSGLHKLMAGKGSSCHLRLDWGRLSWRPAG